LLIFILIIVRSFLGADSIVCSRERLVGPLSAPIARNLSDLDPCVGHVVLQRFDMIYTPKSGPELLGHRFDISIHVNASNTDKVPLGREFLVTARHQQVSRGQASSGVSDCIDTHCIGGLTPF